MYLHRPKTLVVGLDGSPASRGAFAQAMILAASLRGRLVAVAVVPGLGGLERIGRERERRELLRPYEEALAEAGEAAAAASLPLKKVIETGEAFERLVDVAEAEEASLVVIGDARRAYMERVLLGRNVAKVIGYSPCDVLVVPEGTALDFSRVVTAVDGSRQSLAAAGRALGLAAAYGGTLAVVSVLDVPVDRHLIYGIFEDIKRRALVATGAVAKAAKARGVAADVLLLEGSPYRGIASFARDACAGCLVLGSYGKSGLRRLLLGSVAERVLALAPCPVLVVKAAPGDPDAIAGDADEALGAEAE
ncbi:UspA domain-containing protein [Solidesulfovibrio carbinoliphilus subsp. oakridgensis]|uniref:UspA domain-containing protein n=1 Tax=Solidesulfovibrio carbinoliphilus subsp. oakridgensis TaxID=694327 RepID=G7QBY7_9BACT|nr:universal stress protein [Solidesulfovibrio carbinoliphilus]EHJ46022.1 UspA domain-containing protein [Solidesulfovibrio carbinoliphilus subsp. oakridgensis]